MTRTEDLLPSAKEVKQKIALAEAEEAEKQARMLAEAQAEKKALIDALSKPSGISEEEAIRRGKRRDSQPQRYRGKKSLNHFVRRALLPGRARRG